MNIFQKKLENSLEIKNINIYRIQAYYSIMGGYFWIGCIDFMLKSKSLLEYTYLFSPTEYKKNDKIIKNSFCFLKKLRWQKSIVLSAKSTKNFKSLKYHIIFIKHYFFLVFVLSVEVKMNKYSWKNDQLKY